LKVGVTFEFVIQKIGQNSRFLGNMPAARHVQIKINR
jgi:hypothetical protein